MAELRHFSLMQLQQLLSGDDGLADNGSVSQNAMLVDNGQGGTDFCHPFSCLNLHHRRPNSRRPSRSSTMTTSPHLVCLVVGDAEVFIADCQELAMGSQLYDAYSGARVFFFVVRLCHNCILLAYFPMNTFFPFLM